MKELIVAGGLAFLVFVCLGALMVAGSAGGLDERAAAELTEAEAKLKAADAEADEAEAERLRAEAERIRAEGEQKKAEAEAEAIRKTTDELVADSKAIRQLLVWQNAKSDFLTVLLVALALTNLVVWALVVWHLMRASTDDQHQHESSLLR